MDPLARLASLEGVASGMAATRDGIDAMLRDRGLRRTAPELTGRSLLQGAHASAVLSGSHSVFDISTDARFASLLDDQADDVEYDEVAAAAVRVSTELLGLAPTLATSPLQVLARLHTLAAKGVVPDEDLGRPIQGSARLADLSHLLLEDTTAPALVVAAVAHAEVISLAPFVSHNGIVARALERLVIVARGVDPTSLTVPEAGHLSLRPEYESNLRGYREGGQSGVHSWLLYASAAYAAGAEASPLKSA